MLLPSLEKKLCDNQKKARPENRTEGQDPR